MRGGGCSGALSEVDRARGALDGPGRVEGGACGGESFTYSARMCRASNRYPRRLNVGGAPDAVSSVSRPDGLQLSCASATLKSNHAKEVLIKAQSLQTDALVKQYAHVVNDALGRHRDQTPYKQIFKLVESTVGDIDAGIAVYKDDKDNPHDHFVLGWRDGKLKVLEEGKKGDRTWWAMPRTHFEEVVGNPEPYKDNPMKLDLDWMTKRLGLSGDSGAKMPSA